MKQPKPKKSGCPDCGKTPHKKDCIFANPQKDIKEDWEKEFDKIAPADLEIDGWGVNLRPVILPIKSFIRQLLSQEEAMWMEEIHIQKALAEKRARKETIQEMIEGKICMNCGGKKESNLTDMCGKCLEEA